MAPGTLMVAGPLQSIGGDEPPHRPVLVDRVVALLAVRAADAAGPSVLVDCTVGAGGHAAALFAASRPDTHLVAFDRDPDALALAERRLAGYADRLTLVHAGFDDLAGHVTAVAGRVGPVLGILYDLGVSSMQLDRAERGFSFRSCAPLDMRMDPTAGRTAADLCNRLDERELAELIQRLGEERHARRIARAITAARPLATTIDLVRAVEAAVPARARHAATHPATRTFQALRIAVNTELDRFSASLPQALNIASPRPGDSGDSVPPLEAEGSDSASHAPGRGGRIAVLSYHSLEDRIAKRVFADAARGCVCPPDLPVCGCGRKPGVRTLTRGAERPSAEEVAQNPRARSARLRAVERIDERGGR